MYNRAYRNGRNNQHRNTNYNRNGNRYYGRQQRHGTPQYARNVNNYQRQVANAQAQAMRQYRYALERQKNFYRMAMANRQRWLQQYQSYLRQRMAYAHRLPARYFSCSTVLAALNGPERARRHTHEKCFGRGDRQLGSRQHRLGGRSSRDARRCRKGSSVWQGDEKARLQAAQCWCICARTSTAMRPPPCRC